MEPTPRDTLASGEATTWDELRSRPRYYPDPQATRVRIEHAESEPVVALLFDESFDGIGVICRETVDYRVHEQVHVLYRSAKLSAMVKYVSLTDDGQCRVGLVWNKTWEQ